MASWTCLLFTLICITIAGCDSSFVNLKCTSDNHGRFGHQSLLECIVNLSQEAQDAPITRVIWIKEGAETALIDYNSKTISGDDLKRFTFAEPEWNGRNMNVSILVKNTRIADIGIYKCTVFTDRGECRTSTSLSVSARYSTPTINEVIENKQVTALSCKAIGGYPKGRIHWFDENGTDLTASPEQDSSKTEDGRFIHTSKLDLLPGSILSKYTCAVYNSNGSREEEAQYPVTSAKSKGSNPKEEEKEEEPNMASKVVLPVVTVSVIIGLLIFLIKYKGCRRTHEPIATDNQDQFNGKHQPTEPCPYDAHV